MVSPKILLDEDLLKDINKHYSAYLGDEILHRECFSDPKLDSHFCNPRALVAEDKPCENCGSKEGRFCPVTCDINHFCFCAYAARLGIGMSGKTKSRTAINANLRRDYRTLCNLVAKQKKAIELAEKQKTDPEPPKDEVQLEIPIEDPVEPPRRRKPEGPVLDVDGVTPLITLKEAARVYGCSYVNIHALKTRRRIWSICKDGVIYVRKAEVEALRDKNAARQG